MDNPSAPSDYPQEPRLGFLDGDLLAYPAAAKLDKENDFELVKNYLDSKVLEIIEDFCLDDLVIFLSPGKSFRQEVYPLYKANREATQAPRWLAPCKAYLRDRWGAYAERPYECDDLLGIAVSETPGSLLLSYDKDLKQIPGWYGDIRDSRLYFISPEAGQEAFLLQLLDGDATDNCPGIYSCGPVKAKKWYDAHGWSVESAAIAYWLAGYTFDYFEQMYKCLYILRSKKLEWPELEECKSRLQW